MRRSPISLVLQRHVHELMATPGVVGVARGISRGKPCIRVFVVARTQEVLSKLPLEIEGYPVEVDESGEFRAISK